MTRPTYVPAPVADDLAAQDAALDVTCPLCGAERDAYCVNKLTGRHLHNRISHPQRITTARTQHADHTAGVVAASARGPLRDDSRAAVAARRMRHG